ncbi:NADP-dependent oxidoreductase [Georgenia thermotolerans]|uniref:Zinc-binding dehydrogenase n=1 Tax=Georgenia thermotolerans TaxID=527326 RepID=A0A7J5UUB7_9MICO|nr:NADP-dependent oxidoreductase [Georgenia thermotolerans]KAE8765885.1 zinc-binding dehydrogenase [Georgenia thermotolerans]
MPHLSPVPTMSRVVTLARRPSGVPQPTDFSVEEVELPRLREGDVLVSNEWFSVDPSMRIRLHGGDSAYFASFAVGAPLEGWAVGRTVASEHPNFQVGDYVFHSAGWREHAVVAPTADAWTSPRVVDVSRSRPPQTYLGALGPSGLTSWAGLLHVAELREGDVVYVSAGAGAVGTLAVQIARLRGHRVIASAGSADKVRFLTDVLGADAAFSYRDGDLSDQLATHAPGGIDVYFDNVGGDHLDAALAHLNPGGRVALCGSISSYNETGASQPAVRNLFRAVEKGLTLRGFLARMFADRREEFQRDLHSWLESGSIRFPETIVRGLDAAPAAFTGLFSGQNLGKTLVQL